MGGFLPEGADAIRRVLVVVDYQNIHLTTHRTRPTVFLDALDSQLDPTGGAIREITVRQDEIEPIALRLVRTRALRAMDARHLACAALVLPQLTESDEAFCFATSDHQQAEVARTLGIDVL